MFASGEIGRGYCRGERDSSSPVRRGAIQASCDEVIVADLKKW